jgi:hypothetical protein
MTFSMTSKSSFLRGLLSRRTVLAGAATTVLLAAGGPARAQAQLDQPAPAFTATTAEGKTVSLDSYKGKTVVLEWPTTIAPS